MPKENKPTVEEFLKCRPKRKEYDWSKNEEGLVEIKVPKFKSNFGKYFCKLIKKKNEFTANLDKIGSLVWENCDGDKTVEQILDIVKEEFPDEENIDQRLFLFIRRMERLNYITYT